MNKKEIKKKLDDDCTKCECGNLLTGWDKYCNQCGKEKVYKGKK